MSIHQTKLICNTALSNIWLNKTIGIQHSKNNIRNQMNAVNLNSLVAAQQHRLGVLCLIRRK